MNLVQAVEQLQRGAKGIAEPTATAAQAVMQAGQFSTYLFGTPDKGDGAKDLVNDC